MSDSDGSLERLRATRKAARGKFDAHVARLRGDVEVHGGIAGKAKDEAAKRLVDAGKQGLAIAGESKGIIAGTLAALGLWFFRKPLIARVSGWLSQFRQPAGVKDD